jgi:hypothetical protein
MALPDSYTLKPNAVPQYFDALLDAQAPDRVSTRFLERLGFKSTVDRLLIGVLKELGFINTDGVPAERYHRFHDRSQWKSVLAEGIRDSYSDLFAVNEGANLLSAEDVSNKLRTLYAGKKSDDVIGRIARTFTALCEVADFTTGNAANGHAKPAPTTNRSKWASGCRIGGGGPTACDSRPTHNVFGLVAVPHQYRFARKPRPSSLRRNFQEPQGPPRKVTNGRPLHVRLQRRSGGHGSRSRRPTTPQALRRR